MYSMNMIHYDQWTTCSSLMMTTSTCSWNCYQRPDSSDDIRSFGTSVQLSQFQAIESWIQLLTEMMVLDILSLSCRLDNLTGNGSLHAAWTWVRLLSYKNANGWVLLSWYGDSVQWFRATEIAWKGRVWCCWSAGRFLLDIALSTSKIPQI